MDFSNKIDFLMKLTHIKNKELAAEMSVDRSLISLLRNGKRGMPQNKLHIRRMAESFAKRITTGYQRQAIAEVSGFPGMRTEVSTDILTVQLERWLHGDINLVEHILDGIEQEAPEPKEIAAPKISVPEGETLFFYGSKGKREAFRFLMGNIKEGMIGIFDNTDLDWISSDPKFAAEVQSQIKKRLNKGNSLTQILSPNLKYKLLHRFSALPASYLYRRKCKCLLLSEIDGYDKKSYPHCRTGTMRLLFLRI